MEINRVIFLDIDGVLVIRRCFQGKIHRDEWLGMVQPFVEECVAELNRLTNALDAKIVVSSTWRYGSDARFSRLAKYMRKQGVTGEVIGRTPGLDEPRGNEIQAWLDANAVNASSCVILDDDSDMEHLLPRLVKTDMVEGLTPRHTKEAMDLFG